MYLRFATIGTSNITDKFLQAAALCPDFKHSAIYSRTAEAAEDFAKKHPVDKLYTDLDALAADPEIDCVYIASPNALHYDQTLKMLRAGKHVLCEKSIASNAKEAREMFETAKAHQVILMEAMRSLPDPGFKFIKENLGRLGAIRHASFSFCQYSSRYDRYKEGQDFNIFSRAMSAGALMDIGVYCVEPLIALFDVPKSAICHAVQLRDGIDGHGMIMANYPDMTACLAYSKIANGVAKSEIQGEEGGMEIDAIACPHHITLKFRDGHTEHFDLEESSNNMHYETQRFIDCVKSQTFPEDEMHITQKSMTFMDTIRKQINVVFPAD